MQYSTVQKQYNTIKHIAHNSHHTKYHTTLTTTPYTQNYKKNQEHILYTITTQKRVEPKVDESVLKTARYKKTVRTSYYIVLSYTNLPKRTPHSTSLPLHTLHIPPCLIFLPFTAFSWPSLHFKFSARHLSFSNPSTSSILQIPFTSHYITPS